MRHMAHAYQLRSECQAKDLTQGRGYGKRAMSQVRRTVAEDEGA
jgi:hypothetical protein